MRQVDSWDHYEHKCNHFTHCAYYIHVRWVKTMVRRAGIANIVGVLNRSADYGVAVWRLG